MDCAFLWVAVPTAVVVLVVTAVLLYLYNSGLFRTPEVHIGTPVIRDATIMYKRGSGPYENVGGAFMAVAKLAPKSDLIGLYYDNPDEVPAADLRWAVGAILAEGKEKVDPVLQGKLKDAGYSSLRLPCADMAVTSTSDVSTRWGLVLAIKRTYDAMMKVLKDKKFEEDAIVSCEIYEGCHRMTIMFPLDHVEGFFIPGVEMEKRKSSQ